MTTTLTRPGEWAQPHPLAAGRYLTAFTVEVISGDLHPVAGTEVDAYYRYAGSPDRWSRAETDGEGLARLVESHPELPLDVTVSCGRHASETLQPVPGSVVTLEV